MATAPRAANASRLPATLRALQSPNFQLFLSGQLISVIGTWMQSIAEAWLVYGLTGSSLLLGAVGFSSQFPVFLLAPFGGIVADRFSRQRVVIGTQLASMLLALILAVLTLSGLIRVWHIFVLAASLGVVNAFDIPARQSFLVDMAGKEHMMNALALNSSVYNAARIIGPAIAGILVAKIGEGWCFFANGISYVAVVAGLMMIRVGRPNKPARSASPLAHIIEGFRFLRQARPILALLLLLGLVSLVAMPYTVLMPIFADKILHSGARGLGTLMGSMGAGALLGALTLASRKGVHGLGRWVAISCTGFGVIPGCVCSFPRVLAIRHSLGAGGVLHDAAVGRIEHFSFRNDARSTARPSNGCLFDDVYGNGSIRGAVWRRRGVSVWGASDGGNWGSGGHWRGGMVRSVPAEYENRGIPVS